MKKLGKGFSPYARIDNNGEYFCAKCGKAGFTERKKINGHIGGCNGTKDLLEELGSTTTTTTTTTTTPPSLRKATSKMISSGLGSAVVGASFPLANNNIANVELAHLREELDLIKKTTTNHISHLSGMSGGFADVFSNPKIQIAILVIGVIAIFYILEKGDQKSKTSMGGKILDFAMKKL